MRLTNNFTKSCVALMTTKEKSLQHTRIVIELLQRLGFTTNNEISSLHPSQTVDYLGFNINSKTMMIKLPKQKAFIPIRKLASLIGKISATTSAIFPARLRSRALLGDKNRGLNKKGWNGIIELSNESELQLEWWIKNLSSWE